MTKIKYVTCLNLDVKIIGNIIVKNYIKLFFIEQEAKKEIEN
jgi:hypothetical protein